LLSYGVFDLNVEVESTTGVTEITVKSKTKSPRNPRDLRGLLFLNTRLKNALNDSANVIASSNSHHLLSLSAMVIYFKALYINLANRSFRRFNVDCIR
jgi:hypothetical protein